jgi:hypothetical protein
MDMPCNTTPAKSLTPGLSPETRDIIKRKTGIKYKRAEDLPDSLDLCFCEDLVDVSALGTSTTLQTLILWGCTGVVDVSALGASTALQHLDLSWCTGVVDVSALGASTTLKHLDLTGCTGVVDVSAVPNAIR